jgi:RNA polymerase subunit RPABC4/transcription elongation factor Spt4
MNGSGVNRRWIIPMPVWVIAGLVYLGIFVGLSLIAIPQFDKTSDMPRAGQIALALFAAAIPAVYILLLGYIYGDARRRGMRPWLWVLLAIFIPNAIGIILYFVLRDPKMFYCSSCGAAAKASYTFCPNCSTPLRPACPQCGRGIERGWKHCPHCGAPAPVENLQAPSGPPPRPGPPET